MTDASAGTVAVRLLGSVAVETPSGPLYLRSEKHQMLLCLLALAPGRTVTTDALTDALWGERPPPTAETALRGHIKRVRELLAANILPGARIVSRSRGYALDIDSDRVDAVRFRRLLDARTGRHPTDQHRLLNQALALWRGLPFGGATTPDVVRFEAERLTQLYEAAQEDRCELLLRMGEHQQVVVEAEALVRSQPLRERRTLLLMKALYRSGRQAEALAAYQDLRRQLDEQLGLDPSPELRLAEQTVLAQDPWSDAPSAVVAAPGREGRPALPWWLERALASPMVGRQDLLGDLLAHLQGATGERSVPQPVQVLLLRGEPGTGKSRLLAELATRARGELGYTVCAGWCDPEGVIPFRPLMEVFRDLAAGEGALPSSLRDAAEQVRASLTIGEQGEGRSDPETDRLRFFESMATLLREASAHKPLLLLIDDIHWLDGSSAALLRHLLRQRASQPVVVAACYRTHPTEHSRAWLRILPELSGDVLRHHVDVAELSREQSAELVDVLKRDLDPPDANRLTASTERVLDITGGNPLFIREVIARLLAASAPPGSPEVALPPSILASVEERMALLGPRARDAVQAAAVLGHHFALPRLTTVLARTPSQALEALEEAIAHGLVDEVAEGLDEFAFRHALMREAIHDAIPRSRKLRFHFAAGNAGGVDRDVEATLTRAFHLLEAVPLCPGDSAARAAIEAADAAMAHLAFEGAIVLLERAVATGREDTSIDDLTLFELLVRLGRARAYRGDDKTSDDAFAEAAAIARRMGDVTRLAVAALGDDLDTRMLTPSAERLDIMAEALTALGDASISLRVRLASAYVTLQSLHDGPARVRDLADETLEDAKRLGEALPLAKAKLAWLSCRRLGVDPLERLTVVSEALTLAENSGHASCSARARLLRIGALLRLGRLQDASAELTQYCAAAEGTKIPRHQWHGEVVAAALDLLRGRFDEAEASAVRAMRLGERHQIAEARMAYGVHAFFVHWHRGQLRSIRPRLDAYAEARPDLALWRLGAGLAAAAAGDERSARRCLDQIMGEVPELDQDGEFTSNVLMLAAQLAHELGASGADAAVVTDALARAQGQFDVFGASTATLGPVDRALGLLTALQGDLESARALLQGALDTCLRMHSPLWTVWAGTDLVQVLRSLRRHDEAREWTARLTPVGEQHQMSHHLRLLRGPFMHDGGRCSSDV